MRILIVGGTSSLALALKPALSGFAEVVTAGRKNCDLFLDLAKCDKEISVPGNIDVIIHTAAHFGGKEDLAILEAEHTNVLGTLKLCQAAHKAGVKHFIFISSIFTTMLKSAQHFTIYALSKKHAEEVADFYCATHSLPLTILKPSQLYGSGEQFRKHQPFFYNIVDKAANGEDVSLYGTHDPLRNYLHVKDLAKIIVKVIEGKIEGSYDCAHTSNVSYGQVAGAAYKAFDKGGRVCFLADKPDIADNVPEAEFSLYKKIGFEPQISIEEGINELVKERFS